MNIGDRKKEESRFHDLLRAPDLREDPSRFRYYTANKKYYAVVRKSKSFYERWLISNASGRRVLDYGCGDGYYAILAAKHGAHVVGIDISEVSVENARRGAAREGVSQTATFRVMDGEALEFPADSFDIVCESGVLHHVNLDAAMKEIVRVLTPEGRLICAEALSHNPVFQLYRRMTPHLRTRWEIDHILRKRDILRSREWFREVEMYFFHLATLAAVPFRSTPVFHRVLSALEYVDSVLLRMPGLQWYAWQIIYVLSQPVKGESAS